ncbi:MAG: hypothetical protein A2Z97_16535 [Bdellovibrionales bacterium GWB1_52_6]|nr:MAG: hypothetical protein A2Z97_16535 [Bdellovibrionales bacterium GWB1_52_6]OFZ02864.1 MAG: hypothetical protein A2X97_04635 [Bdellovibrionales bacterium GWA1_52_35]HCM38445.1 hypothetical protein [Bdellovibrionales bacterium]
MTKIDLRSLLLSAAESAGSQSHATEEASRAVEPNMQSEILGELQQSPVDQIRAQMADLVAAKTSVSEYSGDTVVTEISSPFSSVLPSLLELKTDILQELENHVSRLLTLNPSRREAIANYLDKLAGGSSGPGAGKTADPAGGLRRWVEESRSPAQTAALHRYFEEIALLVLGQVLLLKAWSDRGIRAWTRADLNNLNWTLSKALKPMVPLDREGWQITRPNLYSWYVPSIPLQEQIWSRFDPLPLANEGPTCLATLLNSYLSYHSKASHVVRAGFDPRFLKALWDATGRFGLDGQAEQIQPTVVPRKRIAFSPTLRDGTLVRTGPVSMTWLGAEESLFLLLSAELAQLWWGPSSPPLWAVGSGLEAHSRDQLSLGLGLSKPSLMSRIAEIESCDTAFVLEEKTTRGQGRGLDAQAFREQLEALPYFKKLRRPGTTLGALQACVALSKLRPGGVLWWAREEAIGAGEGDDVLNFLLDRAKIICEWDFSDIHHALPHSMAMVMALFPKHLYLLAREPRIEERLNHRPLRLSVHGNLRSHVEIPLLFQDAFERVQQAPSTSTFYGHGQWKTQLSKSPTPQKDWADHWPDAVCQNTLRSIEALRGASLPLAHAVTVRKAPESNCSKLWSMDPALFGFWIDSAVEGGKRNLVIRPLPRLEQEATGSGFVILVSDESWIAPLSLYLQSEGIQRWLDHHSERKAGRWILDEQTVRFLPVPKTLWRALGVFGEAEASEATPMLARPLPGEWEKLSSEMSYKPRKLREALVSLPITDELSREIHSTVFVRAARIIEQLRHAQDRMASVVLSSGTINWAGILSILPKSEPLLISMHPLITVSGNLPLHIPISKIDLVKMPAPTLMFLTEIGLHMRLTSDHPRILEVIAQQLEGITHPTWSEIVENVRVPRRIELAETTASDILKSYGEQVTRAGELFDLLSACQLY